MDAALITEVMTKLEEIAPLAGAAATVGFDGFTDTIVRVVRGSAPDGSSLHFRSKRDFGQEIVDLDSGNSSFELSAVATKMGGNAPNTAHALGRLGVRVDCIGMLGRPEIHGLFAAMDPNCTLHSFAEPTQTTALEFEDGKVLLAGTEILRTADWPTVRDAVGLSRLVELYDRSHIIGFANWGEVEHSTEIWEGVEREVLSAIDPARSRIILFDLADPSRRERDFHRLTALIARLSAAYEVVLCLNRNESLALARQLAIAQPPGTESFGQAIFEALDVGTLIIRDPHMAMAWSCSGMVKVGTFHTARPRLSTGGGDNFNAGYCFGRLAGFEARASLAIAAAVAGFYVATGDSPTLRDVVDFLRKRAADGHILPSAEAAQ